MSKPRRRRAVPLRAPAWLDRTASVAWGKWRGLVDVEDAAKAADLARLCDLHSTYLAAAQQLVDEGLTVTSETGNVKPHPCVQIKLSAASEMRHLSKSLGLDEVRTTAPVAPGPILDEVDSGDDAGPVYDENGLEDLTA